VTTNGAIAAQGEASVGAARFRSLTQARVDSEEVLVFVTVEDQARQERAVARAKVMTIHKAQLGQREVDFTPVRGAAAISLATQLTIESFSLARLDNARQSRDGIAVRFVPRTRA
jgi:hypothetical protein